ncbi:MAG: 2-amino-4-hydroxy-6-hydroxymethyldihydropteridine diphosphokinase [Betaproteobacteria bacterium]|nr:MAG: 2-amino-4-hydroxy-6-hydroxymethyldihydropteridine diphosphokinase [Betaproteobacteria bacterium]
MSVAAPRRHDAYIGLGSNLDDPAAQIRAALQALDCIAGTRVVRSSSLYRTKPVGYADQPDFVNAVARVATGLAARALLDELLALERVRGRTRAISNGPRTLDLDLLLFDEQSISEPGLTVPHPRMHERAFVLVPLFEIAPELTVPGRGAVSGLLAKIDTRGAVRIDA